MQRGDIKTTCPYCGVGCGVIATVAADGAVSVRGDPDHPANFGRLCSKGAALAETLDLDGRLLYPEINCRSAALAANRADEKNRAEGGAPTGRVSWDEALDHVAQKFQSIIAQHGPDAVAFYVSGQLCTEDYYVANKLMKGFIGSANIDTNSRLCMSSPVAAYKRAFGSDTVPCNYQDLELADLIVLAGSNAAWCHPVLFQRMRAAREQRKTKFVVIDPRKTASCEFADLHLSIQPGTDAILFNGLLNFLRREDHLDFEFLEAHTEGFAAALNAARESAPTIPAVARACGIEPADVAEFYRLFARTPKTVTLYSQGVNQSSSGVDKGNSIINCHLATGCIGQPGMGPFSITGQPNAMGGREVGGLANQLAAHMDFDAASVERVARFWSAPKIAATPGLKAVDMFNAIAAKKIKAVWIMATNPAVSLPDANAVRAALEQCEFVVVSDVLRHTDTTRYAHVLLPAAAWGEKDGSVTNSERRISRQRAFLVAPGETQPDWWMVTQVARRMGYGAMFAYETPAQIFREHARLSNFENDGARDFDLGALAEMSDAHYDTLIPAQWPVTRDAPQGTARMFGDGKFFTPTRKARFVAIMPIRLTHLPTTGSVWWPWRFAARRRC
jgi:assimilatory nitrate reductase catalytic subunit